MRQKFHTVNAAYPHPDDDSEPSPLPLAEAIYQAARVLNDPTADRWTRTKASDELIYSFESQEEQP